MSNFDQNSLNEYSKAIHSYHISHNRGIGKEALKQKAEFFASSLVDMPRDKIAPFFTFLRSTFPDLLSDAQIRVKWNENKFRVFGVVGTRETDVFGYYDDNGTWIRKGTYYTFLQADRKQLNSRQNEVRDFYFKNSCSVPDNLKEELFRYMNQKFWIPRGKIQKPRHEWTSTDHDILGHNLSEQDEAYQTSFTDNADFIQ